MQIDQLVAELLARGDMNDDTVLELNRILDDWRAGRLDPDDESYVRALHARLFEHLPDVDAEPKTAGSPEADRLDGLSIAEWRDRALRAEAELDDLRDAAANVS